MLFLKIARPGLGANLGSFFNYDNEVPQTTRLPRLLSSLKHKFLSLPLSLLFQSSQLSMMNSFIYLTIDFLINLCLKCNFCHLSSNFDEDRFSVKSDSTGWINIRF